jgi:hypothetical protein
MNEDEPRVPAGQTGGGQWTDAILQPEGGFKTAKGEAIPFHLVGSKYSPEGKVVGARVHTAQLAAYQQEESAAAAQREAGKAAREASNKAFLARPKLRATPDLPGERY